MKNSKCDRRFFACMIAAYIRSASDNDIPASRYTAYTRNVYGSPLYSNHSVMRMRANKNDSRVRLKAPSVPFCLCTSRLSRTTFLLVIASHSLFQMSTDIAHAIHGRNSSRQLSGSFKYRSASTFKDKSRNVVAASKSFCSCVAFGGKRLLL